MTKTLLNRAEMIQALTSRVYKPATSMPNIPHAYSLKKEWADRQLFEAVIHTIRQTGYVKKFYRREYIYYDVGSYQYWSMGAPVEETTVLNRALHKKRCAGEYDAFASEYDSMFGTPEAKKEDEYIKSILMTVYREGMSVLDIGAGTGLAIDLLGLSDASDYLGVDPSGEMLKQLSMRNRTAHVVCETAEYFQPSRSYDLVVSLWGSMNHITPTHWERIWAMGRVGVFMFMKPEYIRDGISVEKATGITTLLFDTDEQRIGEFGKVSSFGNYYIVVKGVGS